MAAGFKYNISDGPTPEIITHTLGVALRLRQGSAGRVKTRYRHVALDQRTIDTVTLEGGAEELEAMARIDPDPVSLLDLLEAGADGRTLNYYEDLSGETSFPFILMNAADAMRIVLDRARYGLGEWEVQLVLRRVDGGNIDGLIE